jgi:hypothetical protein
VSEDIILPPPETLIAIADKATCASCQLNLTMVGGSFSVSFLKGGPPIPPENSLISLPFGRLGTVRNIASSISSGGLLDVVSGPALPLSAIENGFTSIIPARGNSPFSPSPFSGDIGAGSAQDLKSLASKLAVGMTIVWRSFNPLLKSFVFRGIIISGIQQLAQIVLGDVVVYGSIIYVVPPGTVVGSGFSVPATDIINVKQEVDYSQDFPSILNPALLASGFLPNGQYIYDEDHAKKEPNSKLSIGAPTGTGSKDFIEIPDGWMIEGEFEEWIPTPDAIAAKDFTNPAPTPPDGRYWKTFASPTTQGAQRGIISFTRLVKDLKLNGKISNPNYTTVLPNISTFVGSPVTETSNPNISAPYGGGPGFLGFDNSDTQLDIYGFNALDTVVDDIVSDNDGIEVTNAMILLPPGADGSGFASQNFYTIQYGLWTFPKVLNTPSLLAGDPTNPYNIPPGTEVVNPSSNVVDEEAFAYYADYLAQYKKIHSPRLKTSVTCLFRGNLPQPGDSLSVGGVKNTGCGRINSVSLNESRGGITLSIQAELYNFRGAP